MCLDSIIAMTNICYFLVCLPICPLYLLFQFERGSVCLIVCIAICKGKVCFQSGCFAFCLDFRFLLRKSLTSLMEYQNQALEWFSCHYKQQQRLEFNNNIVLSGEITVGTVWLAGMGISGLSRSSSKILNGLENTYEN